EDDMDDDLYEEARETVIEAGKASTSFLQRKLKIGYARAARLVDMLEERGVIGQGDGAKARQVLISNDSNLPENALELEADKLLENAGEEIKK
ncbi:MAG: DNA translocase FtsK, partial [Patescibacteria group bacterium]